MTEAYLYRKAAAAAAAAVAAASGATEPYGRHATLV